MAKPSKTLRFSPNALAVLEKRYLERDDYGVLIETPQMLLERVSSAIAEVERKGRASWAERFYALMSSKRFLPNSPTLMNAGHKEGQLSACYVLPIEDSLEGIFDALKYAALIHQSGGGTGFAFSRVRPAGSRVRSTHGVASGPLSFMRIFDQATETIKQGGARRGANMAVLRVDHPDILDFIESKRSQKEITNFNISVGATDAFMQAVRAGEAFSLRDPRSGKPVKEVQARSLFERIVQSAWECGDPGLVFLDRINRFNPTPHEGEMESTNPCGEQPLLAYESCNLGSMNLGEYIGDSHQFDWETFRQDVHLAVRFLDNVIDANFFPVEQCRKITLRNRKIGLGVMGFADSLLLLGIPYGSSDSVEFAERVMSFLDREAKHASVELARERGEFPGFKRSLWRALGYPPLRNATVSTVAPTGTISMIAGASSGIEPIFSAIYDRNVLDGQRLREVHPAVERALASSGRMAAEGSQAELKRLLGPAWVPAFEVSVTGHLAVQAAFQRHSDSAVSKTINLPESATQADVSQAYWQAYEWGCKGITVYRDQSRDHQVLEAVDLDSPQCPSC